MRPRRDAAPHSRRHQTQRATTLDPAPHSTRHQKRRATTLEAAPQSMRRPVSLRGGQLTSGRVSLGRPEVLEAQVVDGQVRLAPAAELLDADPRGIGRLGGGRSEERRVGKECKSRWGTDELKEVRTESSGVIVVETREYRVQVSMQLRE